MVSSELAFSKYPTIKDLAADLANKGRSVKLDLLKSGYIDPTVMEGLEDLKKYFVHRSLSFTTNFSSKHITLGVETTSSRKLIAEAENNSNEKISYPRYFALPWPSSCRHSERF